MRTTGTLKLEIPQHCRLIILIERFSCVNEEESPVLLLGILLPKEAHRVDYPLDACINPSEKLICRARPICLLYHHLQDTLLYQLSPSFPNYWLIVEANQAARGG